MFREHVKNAACNDVKFPCSDIVCLGNSENKDTDNKGVIPSTTRRPITLRANTSTTCTAKPLIPRVAGEASKFPSIQPKVPPAASPKSIQVIQRPAAVVTTTKTVSVVSLPSAAHILTPTVRCDTPMSVPAVRSSVPQQNFTIRRRQNMTRPGNPLSTVSEEIMIPIVSAETGCVITPKQESTRNGQITPHQSTPSTPSRKPNIPAGLTITPITNSALPRANNIIEMPASKAAKLECFVCTKCTNTTRNQDRCEHCLQPLTGAKVSSVLELKDRELITPSATVIGKAAVFSKETFYGSRSQETTTPLSRDQQAQPQQQSQQQQTRCFPQNTGTKVIVMDAIQQPPTQPNPRGRPRGSRNRVPEPVCLTISSDDEEPGDEAKVSSANEVRRIGSPLLRQQPHSLRQQQQQQQQQQQLQQRQQPQRHFPNLRGLSRKPAETVMQNDSMSKSRTLPVSHEDEEEIEDEEMVEEEEDDDEEEMVAPSEEMNSSGESINKEAAERLAEDQHLILCRSVRIGSFKIHPMGDKNHIPVHVSSDGFSFQAPRVKGDGEVAHVTLTESDIKQAFGHFGRCLPIIFISATPSCAERIRRQLGMSKGDPQYFDPEECDEKKKIITFLIDTITEELKNFLRHLFPNANILQEVDQKTANEILVKSTPNQNQSVKFPGASQVTQGQVRPPVVIQTVPVVLQPPAPVKKILTYPPPPQTGGIEITSDDLLCLDEGEFLNDAIIDFYLKYLMNEKLSEEDRKRTHIFSSFFYPRLTQKPITRGKCEEGSMSVKRHTQVRTWTKNVDIFEKDFIIIPINQNVHWFLAIICFPGLVPDAPSIPPAKPVTQKPGGVDSVSSTNDQDSCESSNASQSSYQTNDVSSLRHGVSTKDQACSTDDQSSDDSSPYNNCFLTSEAESNFMEEPLPEAPDSSTHPDRHVPKSKMPCILIFDSLSGPSRWRIVSTLREYLDMEWKMKKGTQRVFSKMTMQGHVPRVPQQTNFSDCGIYVLQYVESFFENPFPYFASPMPALPEWFPDEKVASKREEIKNLIFELQKRQSSSCAASSSSGASRMNTRQNSETRNSATSMPSNAAQNIRLSSS